MKITAVIIDDENHNIHFLKKILEDYTSELIDIVGTANTAENAIDLINQKQPNLLFLDIKLDIGTSFDVLKKIDPYPYLVVFATAYQDFALESFNVNAVHYILKPLSVKDVVGAVNRAVKQYRLEHYTSAVSIQQIMDSLQKTEQQTNYLEVMGIPEVGGTRFVRLDTIIYCKSDGRYTEIYLNDGGVQVSARNIGKYEEALPEKVFFRIHKSYLINLNHILQIVKRDGNYCHMDNGDKLPIAKRKLADLTKLIHLG